MYIVLYSYIYSSLKFLKFNNFAAVIINIIIIEFTAFYRATVFPRLRKCGRNHRIRCSVTNNPNNSYDIWDLV